MRSPALVVSALAAAIVCLPDSARAATGPAAAYGFEDGPGTVVGDSSAYGHIGTVVGGGPRDRALRLAMTLDGSNDRVRIADAGALNLARA